MINSYEVELEEFPYFYGVFKAALLKDDMNNFEYMKEAMGVVDLFVLESCGLINRWYLGFREIIF